MIKVEEEEEGRDLQTGLESDLSEVTEEGRQHEAGWNQFIAFL